MPNLRPPQTGRRPLPLSADAKQKLLRRRVEEDKFDPFASDPNPEVNEWGRLALRSPSVDYAFALADLCAERSIGGENRLRVFYAGKTIIAYTRAYAMAKNDVDKAKARNALDEYVRWLVDVALAVPTQRNIAVALWAAAQDESDEPLVPHIDAPLIRRLLEAYRQPAEAATLVAGEKGSNSPLDDETAFDAAPASNPATHFDHPTTGKNDALSDVSETRADLNLPVMSQDQGESGAMSSLTHIEDNNSPPASLPSIPEDAADSTGYQHKPLPKAPMNLDEEYDFHIGQRIEGRYEVVDIRAGGMGVVYLCYDQDKREPVAIKTFKRSFLENERAIARFEHEAFTWIQLERHSNIVQARLVQNINQRPHIFLEHISGQEGIGVDLRSWIDHNRLTVAQSMLYGIHIALGMQHATTKVPRLVHRDLKPGNILVTHDGIAKITDFGLVRSLDASRAFDLPNGEGDGLDEENGGDTLGRLTRVNAAVGTPPYMSPEQCEAQDVDLRSDVYAFGIVLYEMLTGRHPFKNRANSWKEAHLKEIPDFDRAAKAKLPAALRGLVLQCMAKKPEDRPQTWMAVVETLSGIYRKEVGELPTLDNDGIALQARELMDKGYSLTELGRLEEALEAYDRAIQLQPDYAWAWARRARTLRLLERYEEALACYDRALTLDPNYAWAYNGKGIILDRLQRHEDALVCFTQATELNPRDVWYWYNRGDLLDKLGRRREAMDALQRGLSIDARHPNSHARLGQIYRTEKQYDAAIQAYEQAIRLSPEYAWAHNGCGLSLKALGRLNEAILSFRRATRYQPEVVWHWYNLAETLIMTGRYQEALPPAREATRMDPLHAPSWGKLGQVLRYLKRYEEALDAYERAVELDEKFDWALNGKGIILEQLERFDEALDCYRQAAIIDPDRDWYYYNQANVLMLLERFNEALPLLEHAIAINPDYARSHSLRGSVLRQMGRLNESLESLHKATRLDPGYAWAWNELGQTYEIMHRYEDALQAYVNVARHEPDKANPYYKQADVLVLLNRYDEALQAIERALRINGRSANFYAKHGQILRRLNRYDEALVSYTQAVEIDPAYAWAWSGRGLVLSDLSQGEEALRNFKRAIDLSPGDVWYWYNYAEELMRQGQADMALEALDEALHLNPTHAESWGKCGQALQQMGRLDEALAAYNKAIEFQPNYAWAWNARALTLRLLGQLEEALASYERALEIDPHSPWNHLNTLALLLDMGRLEEALRVAETAIQIAPHNATVWARRGQVLRRLKRHEAAVESYDRALKIDPDYAWCWNGKGMSMMELGHLDAALECFRQAVKFDERDAWFWHNLGDVQMRLNLWDEAEVSFGRALELDHYLEAARTKQAVVRDRLKRRKAPSRPKTPPPSSSTVDARGTRPADDLSSHANEAAPAEALPKPEGDDDNN